MSAEGLVDLIALLSVLFAIVLAAAVVLAVAKLAVAVLSAPMCRTLRRGVMLTIWATASLLVIVGLGATVNDAVHVPNLSTNGVGIQD